MGTDEHESTETRKHEALLLEPRMTRMARNLFTETNWNNVNNLVSNMNDNSWAAKSTLDGKDFIDTAHDF